MANLNNKTIFFKKPSGKVWVYDPNQHDKFLLDLAKKRGDVEIENPRKAKKLKKTTTKKTK